MKIKVTRPFSVQFTRGEKRRAFEVGVYELTDKEMEDWFVKACLEEGRAELVADRATQPAANAESADGDPAETAPPKAAPKGKGKGK